jgi:hypothetical protein
MDVQLISSKPGVLRSRLSPPFNAEQFAGIEASFVVKFDQEEVLSFRIDKGILQMTLLDYLELLNTASGWSYEFG